MASGGRMKPSLPPYRRWFVGLQGAPPLEAEALVDRAVTDLERKAGVLSSRLGASQVERWGIDQDRGVLELEREDGSLIRPAVQIVGSHDGSTWLWADANPNVVPALAHDAQMLRGWLHAQGLGSLAEDRLEIAPADAWGLTALAASALRAAGAYACCGDERQVLVTLRSPQRVPSGGSLPEPPPADFFDQVRAWLAGPLPTLPVERHRRIQELANRGWAALANDRSSEAVTHFEEAWSLVPEWPWEQACAGWLVMAMAEAEAARGRVEEAVRKLAEGLRCRAVGLDWARATVRLGRVANWRTRRAHVG